MDAISDYTLLWDSVRRICRGQATAKISIEIISAYLLWTSGYRRALDLVTGREGVSSLDLEKNKVFVPEKKPYQIVSLRHRALWKYFRLSLVESSRS